MSAAVELQVREASVGGNLGYTPSVVGAAFADEMIHFRTWC